MTGPIFPFFPALPATSHGADCPHHVTARGNRREPIFFEDGDQDIYTLIATAAFQPGYSPLPLPPTRQFPPLDSPLLPGGRGHGR